MAFIAKQRYKLDIAPKGGWVIVYASQHDDGAREIEFAITNQGNAFSIPASINVSVQGIKSNGSYFSHSCSYSGNIVTMALADDMTDIIGKAICVLKFTNSSQQKLATAKFVLNVDTDSSSEGVIIDTEAEEIFNQMLNDIRAQASAISVDIAELQSMVGSPLVASTASSMTDHNKIYVYTGSESGYTNGNWYYWNGSAWTSGGVYNSTAFETDKTLSVINMAADAKAVGDTRQAMNMVANNVYSYSSIVPEATINSWRLHESNGLCYSASDYKIIKYKVNSGDVIKIVCDDRWQFQNAASVPSSGSSNRVGITGGVYDGILTVPIGATYIMLSSLKASNATSVSTVSDKVSSMATVIEDNKATVDEVLDMNIELPINRVDPSSVITGRYLYNGTIDSSESYKTTGYIAVNNGDVLRFFKTANNDGVNLERTTGERLALFDVDKNYLGVSRQYPCNINTGYTVENESAKFVRVSYSASFDPVELTVNTNPNNFTNYEPPYYTSTRLERIESIIGVSPVTKIIDCWGDSRTDMNDDGTSFSDYLATLLGSAWIVSNRGISGQASGQVSARYGSNEIYLTLENNIIPASGNASITTYRPTTGTDTNLRGGDSTYGVHGILNGIPGKYIHTTGGNIYFARDYDGVAVKVKPRTKLLPDPYFNADHCQILWCGKNDFSYAYPNIVSGITGNYDGMVGKIPHDKFIILGETNSIGESYLPGHNNRGYVDNINAYLVQKYPDNFIDIQSELITNGLTLEGITPTAADTENIDNGFIPDSLMYDDVHLNQYGREAVAKIIYAWMQEKEWI